MNMRVRILPALAMLVAMVMITSCSSRRQVPAQPAYPVVSSSGNPIVREAMTWLGTPYGYGRCERGKATDCSGMVWQVHRKFGIDLPRNSRAQSEHCRRIKRKNIAEGDLVFFDINGRGVSHVGIYIGEDRFIHSSTRRGVIVSSLTEPYYSNRYHGAGRVPDQPRGKSSRPGPKPAPAPEPLPTPAPETVPEPVPEPVSEPAPEPAPAPESIPPPAEPLLHVELPQLHPDTVPSPTAADSIASEVRNAFMNPF